MPLYAFMCLTLRVRNWIGIVSFFLLCFDFEMALDTINPQLLLHKLYDIRLRGPSLLLFNNYFHNRVQCVKVRVPMSKNRAVNFGTPQRSVVGRLLFNIYVNYLNNIPILLNDYMYWFRRKK